jgi:hypothetical protein
MLSNQIWVNKQLVFIFQLLIEEWYKLKIFEILTFQDALQHVLMYQQKPIVSTKASADLGYEELGSGINCVVVVMTWKGYNQVLNSEKDF